MSLVKTLTDVREQITSLKLTLARESDAAISRRNHPLPQELDGVYLDLCNASRKLSDIIKCLKKAGWD